MRKGISWCVGAGNGSTSAALVLPSAKSNKQRSILPSKECPLFIWSRKRESNPPGSAWEADAIPLGDSCIFCCIVFVSRFHGNGSTFAQLRFASRARWLALAPARDQLGKLTPKTGFPQRFCEAKDLWEKEEQALKLRPDEGGAGKGCLAPTRRFLHELSFYISIIAEKRRAVKRKKCGKKRNFREFWHFSAAFSA